MSLRTAAILTRAVSRQEVAEPVRQADLLGRAAVKQWLAGAPLVDMRISGAHMHRKGVECSVLPVIRNLLAKQDAEELGEDWAPVESRRQRRPRQGDRLQAVPGVTRVSLPDAQASVDERRERHDLKSSRKKAGRGMVKPKARPVREEPKVKHMC